MKKIGFIGAGNMATAIINGLIAQKGSADFINVYDVNASQLDAMKRLGANVLASGGEVVKNSDIIVLAVKPQNYAEVLDELKAYADESKTFVSIAAGISIGYVQSGLGCECPVMRVMPNTPLLLKKGATALCPSGNMSDGDKQTIYEMFAGSGVCEYLTEDHMNEIIAVNGSSPAFIYLFAKAMADYARESGDSADTLIQKVSSKGGTTIAALDKLREHGFYEAIQDAMDACTKRAEELGR